MAKSFRDLCEKVPEHEREHVCEIAENVLFMRRKLAETRKALNNQAIVIPYDNGGGQVGIRANPAFGEYQRLLRSYTTELETLRGILASAAKAEEEPKSNPLMDILAEAEKVIANA
jgi:hypothetical protein